jgi:hypothetical protein
MAPTGHSTSGSVAAENGPWAVASHGAQDTEGTEAIKAATETAISLHASLGAHDQQGDGCSCCPTNLDIAVACATVNTGSPHQHGTLTRVLDEDGFVTPDLASSSSAAQRAAPPPSLAELSLLRI